MVKFLACTYVSHSAHRTTKFMNPEFQFPEFKVLQSVFNIESYAGIVA